MVTVTETAAEKIRTMLTDQGHPEYGLRMMIMGGGCSGFQYRLAFDKEASEADRVIEAHGVRVFVDMKSAIYLMGSELDYVEGLMGAGFKINNPNAKGTCGCGESFHV
ncbi:MAG: iron-sulfur cluster insertion protein ErpA [Candidatus Latescibacteria bacterium]|nr:iron-sulfur cluster insertion protein ErpA [Candidatus Latescibacterota bacterium]